MSDLISSTKKHIKKIAPFARDVVIQMEKDHDKFLSKILVYTPGALLKAEKKAETFWEALDSSYGAVAKQIEKLKSRKKGRRSLRRKEIWGG